MDILPFCINENPPKLHQLCRMCATPCNKSVPIFSPQGQENELASKLNKHLPLKVSETDSMPLQLCYECTNLLMQWDAAILVAVAADKKLRALLWREQQYNSKDNEEIRQPEQPRKRLRSSPGLQESLSCSVCNTSGMDFRELVEHLKTHDGPSEETEKEASQKDHSWSTWSTITHEEERGGVDSSIDDDLTPVVSLESLGRELRSKLKTIAGRKEKGLPKKRMKRGRPKRSSKRLSAVSLGSSIDLVDLEDPVVTSSTSIPVSAASETLEGHSHQSSPSVITNDGANQTPGLRAAAGSNLKKEPESDDSSSLKSPFKPKVRIISAESINQTLEERAKANQTARNLESPPGGGRRLSDNLICSPPSGGGNSPAKSPVLKRLVLSGQLVPNTNLGSGSGKPGQKFLKLADGRIIKILQGAGSTASNSVQKVKVLSYPKMIPVPPGALKAAGNLPSVISGLPDKSITFSCQPGPKHCANRYICGLCGKRNLTQESMQEHAQLHLSNKLPLGECGKD